MKKNWLSNSLALFAFCLPWQLKLILVPGKINGGANNFLEISIYGFAIILFLFVALAIRKIIIEKKFPEKFTRFNLFLILLSLALFLSIFFANNIYLSLWHLLYFFIGLAFLFVVQILKNDINWGFVSRVFLVSCFASALLGIFQFTKQEVPEIKYLVASHQVAQHAGESVLENSTGRLLRAYGSFDHPNIFGGVMVFALLLVIEMIFRVKKKNDWLFLIFLFIIFSLALLMSFSRSAWLALIVALLVRLGFNYRKELFKILMVFALLGGVAMIFFGSNPGWLKSRVSGVERLENASIEERWTGIQIASQQIISQPFKPVALNNYSTFLANKHPNLSAWNYQPVHNVWLLLAVETGFWSSIIFFSIYLLVFLENKKKKAIAASFISALLVLSLFDHWLISLPFGLFFGFFILSLSLDETIL